MGALKVPLQLVLRDLAQQRIAQGQLSGRHVQQQTEFTCLLELLPSTDRTAFGDLSNRRPVSHSYVASFVGSLNLLQLGIQPGVRVGVVLPTGPELALCLVCLLSRCVAAPINYASTPEEVRKELSSFGASVCIVLHASQQAVELKQYAKQEGISVLELVPDQDNAAVFTLMQANTGDGQPRQAQIVQTKPAVLLNQPQDIALILHTSGSTGNKKVVPYTLRDIATGVICIAVSQELCETDVCCGMMPLFHAGGIFRTVLAPLLSGGAAVYMPFFDAASFWESMDSRQYTWYYGAPTMHVAILDALKRIPPDRMPKSCMRLIANAAGGLLPSIAAELFQHFPGACIMPSYGMTECMPISAPPPGYRLEKPGSSGQLIGPEVMIAAEGSGKVRPGQVGHICIRGPPTFHGYLGAASSGLREDGWFDTGDMGWLDEDGYLFITGRSKEVINRGGEIISPFEVEESLAGPGIQFVVAFSAPHDILQEVVAVVVVPQKGCPRPSLSSLLARASEKLHPSKWPCAVVYMDEPPRAAGGTGKVVRVNLAKRLKFPTLADGMTMASRQFEADSPPPGSDTHCDLTMRAVVADPLSTEAALRRCVGVRDAAVVTATLRNEPQLVAYVSPASIDATQLLQQQQLASLHEYQRPAIIVPVPALHRGPHGDVLMAELPDPVAALQDRFGIGHVAARSKTEERVAALWQEVLGRSDPVSVTADFFELGGSSLMAGLVAAQLRSLFHVPASGLLLFSCRTVEQLATYVDGHTAEMAKGKKLQRSDSSIRLLNDLMDAWGSMTSLRSTSFAIMAAGVRRAKSMGSKVPLAKVSELIPAAAEDAPADKPFAPSPGGATGVPVAEPRERVCSQHSSVALLVQSLPLMLFAPLRRVAAWLLFLILWAKLQNSPGGPGRFQSLILAIILSGLARQLGAPFIAIAFKWIVIGRFKAGHYPLWGSYYLRWWLVDQMCTCMGLGWFTWWGGGVALYCRMMGAKVGHGVMISPEAVIGEFDLLHFGSQVALDPKAYCRAASVERQHLLLSAITLEDGCLVCSNSSLHPAAHLPSATIIGPNSSSHDPFGSEKDAKLCQQLFPMPPLWLKLVVGYPLVLIAHIVRVGPVVLMLIITVDYLPNYVDELTRWSEIVRWLTEPDKIGLILATAVVYRVVSPFWYLTAVICVKWLVIGKFKPGPRARSSWNLLRHWLMQTLMPGGDLGGVTTLLGPHWEGVSFVYRMLGARVGRRVFWPGSGVRVVEYDLLEVGDDVVWGSRSTALTCDADNAAPIYVGSGANVADRCFLCPGVIMERNSTLGTGGLAPRNFVLASDSIWVGSYNGCAVNLKPGKQQDEVEDTIKPFGRAAYLRQASYLLPGVLGWAAICTSFSTANTVYNVAPLVASVLATAHALGLHIDPCEGAQNHHLCSLAAQPPISIALLFGVLVVVYVPMRLLSKLVIVSVDIGVKWMIIGRREPGDYPWDKSPYNMCWKLHLMVQAIREPLLRYLHGSAYLVWYYRAIGSDIREHVCLFPLGSDPMMTEPDLVTIGEHACINAAYLICHTNSGGIFALDRVTVGPYSTMRAHARLMAGGRLGAHAMMLEHTLGMQGEVIDAGTVCQGWPMRHMSSKSGEDPGPTSVTTLGRPPASPGQPLLPVPEGEDGHEEAISNLQDVALLHSTAAAWHRGIGSLGFRRGHLPPPSGITGRVGSTRSSDSVGAVPRRWVYSEHNASDSKVDNAKQTPLAKLRAGLDSRDTISGEQVPVSSSDDMDAELFSHARMPAEWSPSDSMHAESFSSVRNAVPHMAEELRTNNLSRINTPYNTGPATGIWTGRSAAAGLARIRPYLEQLGDEGLPPGWQGGAAGLPKAWA